MAEVTDPGTVTDDICPFSVIGIHIEEHIKGENMVKAEVSMGPHQHPI